MVRIAVVGSGFFKQYVNNITQDNLFPHIELSFIDAIQLIRNIHSEETREKLEKQQYHAFVLGKYDYAAISPYINIPCYAIEPDIQDFLLLYPQMRDCKNPAVVCPVESKFNLSVLETCFGVKYHMYYFDHNSEIDTILKRVKCDGHTTIIAPNNVFNRARELGLKAYYYFSQKNIEDGIRGAEQVVKNLEREKRYISEMHAMLENTTCGVVYLTGETPTVTYVNRTALDLLKRQREDFFSIPTEKLFPKQVLDMLIGGGEAEKDTQFTLFGIELIGNMIPLEIEPGVPGVCLLFERVSKIIESEAKIRQEIKRKNFGTRYSFNTIIGNSEKLKNAIAQAKRFAVSNSTILINAESGAGKEVFAQSIHDFSPRRQYPFVAINCASIPDTLIESELFGYAPNSFTGASSKGKRGLLELANHGTVFLDDVDALSPSFQSKLLRVMQEKEIIQVGGNSPIPVDIRFVVATNRDLKEMVSEGKFRYDLYFRINVLHLRIPPLRERQDDILLLYRHYLKVQNQMLFEKIEDRFPQIFSKAQVYDYPGNVRELINISERFSALAEYDKLSDDAYLSQLLRFCLDTELPEETPQEDQIEELRLPISGVYVNDVAKAEELVLQYYVKNSDGNMSQLAKTLGVSRATLYNKLRSL